MPATHNPLGLSHSKRSLHNVRSSLLCDEESVGFLLVALSRFGVIDLWVAAGF